VIGELTKGRIIGFEEEGKAPLLAILKGNPVVILKIFLHSVLILPLTKYKKKFNNVYYNPLFKQALYWTFHLCPTNVLRKN
jgi:hypothetical protein